MKKIAVLLLLSALVAPVMTTPAKADDGFHGRGHWYYGWHRGREGRWWVSGNYWTFYPPYPVYPAYPAYYPAYTYSYPAPYYAAPVVTVPLYFGWGHRHW